MSNATEMAYGNRTDFSGSESRFTARRIEALDHPVDHKQKKGRAEAWISAGVGGILVGSALRRRSRASLPLTAVGAFLFYRGVTRHCPGYAAAGIDRSERRSGPDAVSVITINKPVEEVYRFWRNLNNLPQFMNAVESVEVLDQSRSRWRTRELAGQSFTYEAEIIEDTPNNGIRWKSVSGSPIEMRGTVRFKEAPAGRGTIVIASMIFGRGKGSGIAGRLASPFAKYAIHQDLLRLRRLLETGELPSTEEQPAGPRDSEELGPARRQPAREAYSGAREQAYGAYAR